MKTHKGAGFFWRLFLALFVCFPLVSNAQGLQAQSDDEDDEKTPPALYVNISMQEDGGSQIHWIDLHSPLTAPAIRSVLQSALGCTLQDGSNSHLVHGVYQGSCRPSETGTSLVHQFRISTSPFFAYARERKLEVVTITLHLPDFELTESEPPVVSRAAYPAQASERLKRAMELNRVYTWRVDDAHVPEFIAMRAGYRESTILQDASILLLVLFAPVLLVAWLGRRALGSDAADKAPLWFSYMRSLNWLLTSALIGWWIAAESLHLISILKFLSAASPLSGIWNFSATATFVDWLPPVITWVLCFAVSHPVQQRLRGLSWTRRELAQQALYSFCASMLPLALFLTGLQTIAANSFRTGLLWFVAAFVVKVFASQALAKLLGMQPQAVTTGDLRDRAFATAQLLGVKLQQIYVIPSGKGQMANAFARTGNTISFTDFLLQRMSRREVNYVLAHELSHLKLRHPNKLVWARSASIFLAVYLLGSLGSYLHNFVVLRYTLIISVSTLIPYFWSRRFEYAADASAVAATGDPEAAISALFKLSQLNMLPIHWSHWTEKWLTHPSTLRRAQAVALKASLPLERVPDIARNFASSEDHYTLPSTVASGAKIHNTQCKQSGIRRATYIMLVATILTPCAFATLATRLRWSGPASIAIEAVGLVVTIAIFIAVANFVPPMGLKDLVQSLKAKLAQENVFADSWDGTFVGLSPWAVPRTYESNTNWDIGCLFIRSDRICYVGEETRFALRREQVSAITLAPGIPGLLRPYRVYFSWKSEEEGKSGAFNIGLINGSSTLELRREAEKLTRRLEDWKKSPAPPRALPEQLAALTTPDIGAVTSTSLEKMWNRDKVFKELLWMGIFATVGAVLSGLPFHLLAFLLPPGRSVDSPGAGWYVVAVAVIVRLVSLVPLLKYKENPAVIIPSVDKPAASPHIPTAKAEDTEKPEDIPVGPRS